MLRTYEPDLFLQAVTEARENSDFVAAYVHWGTENTAVLETAQREQARQYIEAARTLLWAHIRTACRALHLSTEACCI